MSRLFRLAIVGCGRIAAAHAQAVLVSPLTELAVLVDPVEAHAAALARRLGVSPPILPSVEGLASLADAAIIATPNHTHADLAVRCLEAGLPVLVEKPLATSVAEGRSILDAAERTGQVVAVGYTTRFRGNVRLMRALLQRRYFGAVRRFVYQFGSPRGWAPFSAYNLDRRMTGGGVLVVTGTHFLDRMLDWFGYPTSVSLADDSRGGPEANAVARFVFDSDTGSVHGWARFSKSVELEAGLVMDTDVGIVVFRDRPDAPIVVRPVGHDAIETIVRPRGSGEERPTSNEFLCQLEDFVGACRGEHPPMVDGAAGLMVVQLTEQLYASRSPLADDWYAGTRLARRTA